jgi:mannose-1-phosphate guanylyltransferase
MKDRSPVFALVLAGGAGTRFWPASRALRPKQMLPLVGDAAMLRQTVERVLPLCAEGDASSAGSGWGRVRIATGVHLQDAVRTLLPELAEHQLFLEPVARNTAPCIAWAAWVIARTEPDAVVMVLPSDHHIADVKRFRATLRAAVESARTGVITTIGVRPTRPETGFGYIEVEGPAEDGKARRALKFVEKPDAERAAAYVAGGRHLWNAGMFFFRAKDMVAAVERHLPKVAEGLRILDQAAGRGEEEQALFSVFPNLPSISIDHGVMDHLPELAVVPGDFGWSDVGSFQAAWELGAKDEHANVSPPGSVLVEGSGNYVLDLRAAEAGKKRVIALVGVDDLVVVETDDALLVTRRDRAQDVKLVVDELKRRGEKGLI